MMKKASIISGLIAITLLFATITAHAAEQGIYNHDTQTDTTDYCLGVYDVSIDISEFHELGDDEEKIQSIIIEKADPKILVRGSTDFNEWMRLSFEDLRFDFSQFKQEENPDGYTVAVSAPAIRLKEDSMISFKVYVTNNNPDVYATIHFANTEFADMELNITKDNSLFVSDVDIPTKDGYTFLGWYSDENCTEPFLLPNDATYAEQTITGDLTLYSKWEKDRVYAIVHFANSDLDDIRLDVTEGGVLSIQDIETPIKDGYDFCGWYIDENYSKPFLLPNGTDYAEQKITEDITLFSKWEPKVVTQDEAPEEEVQPEKPTITKKSEKTLIAQETAPHEADQNLPVQNAVDKTDTEQPKQERDDELKDIVINDSPIAQNNSLAEKGRIPMCEYFVLALLVILAAWYGFSIAGDLHVLKWYAGKKAARSAKL